MSPASRETLLLQGGPMHEADAAAFVREPELPDMLRLRSWDEMAQDPDKAVPPIESYRDMLLRHLNRS